MKNIIVNSNFSDSNDPNLYSLTYGWIAHNVRTTTYRDNFDNKKYYITDGGKNVYYDLPPGLYQKIDLSEYHYDVKLEIEYRISYYNEIAAQRQNDLISNLYIYEIGSCDSSTKIPVTNVRSYLVKEDVKLYYDEVQIERGNDIVETGQLSITLPPGYYAIGFGSEFMDLTGEGFIANGKDINGLCVERLSANALELTSGSFKLASTSDFESWAVESVSYATDKNFACPITLEDNDVGIRVAYNHTLEQSMSEKNGYAVEFEIPEFTFSEQDAQTAKITGRLSFWYHSSLIGSEFAIYIYDRETGRGFWDDTIEIEENEWRQYVSEFSAWEGKYTLLIIPPKESYKSSYLMLNSIDCSLYIEVESSGGQGGKGTFEEPYNSYDGYIYYWSIKRCLFISDTVKFQNLFFVKINGKYYMSDDDIDGSLCINGFYNSSGVKLTNPDSTSDLRYFFDDGTMAVNESFAYGKRIYTADEFGICRHTSMIMSNIDLKLEGYDYFINSVIDMPRNIPKTIIASFEKQCPYVKLTVTSSDESIAEGVVSNTNLQYDDNGTYNESNTIKVTGYHTGEATITVSYENLDGSIVSKSFKVDVRDTLEYYKYGESIVSLNFLYDENYLLSGKSLDLKYRFKPNPNLPIDWQIVDPNDIFTLSDGVLTAKDTGIINGSCTVSITNYGSDSVDTCKIYLTQNPNSGVASGGANYVHNIPVSIAFEFSKEIPYMEVGDSVDVLAITNGEDGTPCGVTQAVTWKSSRPTIAMVDELGTITALNPGTTKITCTCLENAYVKREFDLSVVQGSGPALQRIDLNMTEVNLLIPPTSYGRSSEFLTCNFYPETTKQTNVKWVSSDPSLVEVFDDGQIRTGYKVSNKPSYNGSEVTITCTSASNPDISASCKVTLLDSDSYEPILYFQKNKLNVYVDEYFEVKYYKSNCDYIEYRNDSMSVSIARKDGQSTTTQIAFDNNAIKSTIKEAGGYVVTATCLYVNHAIGSPYPKTLTNTLEINASESTKMPAITKNLELLYALHNGSFILRYYAQNDVAENFTHYLGIDGTFYSVYADPIIYNGENYYYIFGNMKDFDKMLVPDTYEMSVKVANYSTYSATTNAVTVVMPENEDNQRSLSAAKSDYDIVTDDIINYLKTLITDRIISTNEHLEFETRYKLFNVHYDNLKAMLDICIDYIDEQIKADQATMSTMASNLSSDDIEMATYSIDDYTNSNYSNITDMDYYQNECIKALMQRVLELEAKLNELSNNNNN